MHMPTQEVVGATAFLTHKHNSTSPTPIPGPPGPTTGGVVYTRWGGLHVPALLEHSYCMLEELREVLIMKKEEGQTAFACQNNRNIPPTLLEHSMDKLTYMGQSIRQVGAMMADH